MLPVHWAHWLNSRAAEARAPAHFLSVGSSGLRRPVCRGLWSDNNPEATTLLNLLHLVGEATHVAEAAARFLGALACHAAKSSSPCNPKGFYLGIHPALREGLMPGTGRWQSTPPSPMVYHCRPRWAAPSHPHALHERPSLHLAPAVCLELDVYALGCGRFMQGTRRPRRQPASAETLEEGTRLEPVSISRPAVAGACRGRGGRGAQAPAHGLHRRGRRANAHRLVRSAQREGMPGVCTQLAPRTLAAACGSVDMRLLHWILPSCCHLQRQQLVSLAPASRESIGRSRHW